MKTTKLSILVVLLCVSTGLSSENDNLQGVWQIVSGEMTRNDSTITYSKSEHFDAIMFIGKTHWTVIGQDTKKGMFWAFGGTYTVDGDVFNQIVLFTKNRKSIGNKLVYKFKIEKDLWTIKGKNIHKVWKRIE